MLSDDNNYKYRRRDSNSQNLISKTSTYPVPSLRRNFNQLLLYLARRRGAEELLSRHEDFFQLIDNLRSS